MMDHPYQESTAAELPRAQVFSAPRIDHPSAAADESRWQSSRVRLRYNATLKLVRRAHLFIGLFMTPWVFLYGVTGFLFNHPDAFPDREVRTADRASLAGTELEGFPAASELAGRIVEALNAPTDSAAFRLVDRASAAYSRAFFVTATGRGREHSVRFDPENGGTLIRSTTLSETRSIPWPGPASVPLPDSPRDRLARGVPALLAKLGVDAETATLRNPPDLVCTVEQDGRRWRIAYNLQSGAISARTADDPDGGLSTRLFLTRLHLSFGYPSRVDARWFWAIAVDAMFVAMVFWGASGLLMWWQITKLRAWGTVVLTVSILVAAAMAIGMHESLAMRL
jgi:hypothetical protein